MEVWLVSKWNVFPLKKKKTHKIPRTAASVLAFLPVVLFLFWFLSLPSPKSSLSSVKWKWQKKNEEVWEGNPWAILKRKGEMDRVSSPTLCIRILGFDRKKKGDSKYGMRASLLRRNTTFSFFPQKYEWKIWAECFHEEKKTWSGFFFFFFPGLFCFSAGRETEKCLSRWLLFVRCSCLGFKHSGISRKHFWLQNLHHSEVWAETMDILAKGRDFFNGRIEVQRITLTVRVAKCLGSSWRALEILRLHKEVFQQPL